MTTSQYRCNKCGQVYVRAPGHKLWLKSYCSKMGKDARLYRISSPKEVVKP